ncbi:hypothetical protein VPHK165_0009 [Vibrio phage K165]
MDIINFMNESPILTFFIMVIIGALAAASSR